MIRGDWLTDPLVADTLKVRELGRGGQEDHTVTKRAWKKPELIVLVRGTPEEAVLQNCKGGGSAGPQVKNCAQGGKCSILGNS